MLIWTLDGYNSKLWMGLGDMYVSCCQNVPILRCILFYLKEIYMKLHEIRVAKLLMSAKVLDCFGAI